VAVNNGAAPGSTPATAGTGVGSWSVGADAAAPTGNAGYALPPDRCL
jgi:hypothetical protein